MTESVAIQKEMLAAIQGLRSQTRRNASLLSAALKSGAVDASESDWETENHAEAFSADRFVGDPEDVSDSDYEELPESDEDDHYAASPKMFGAPADDEPEEYNLAASESIMSASEFDLSQVFSPSPSPEDTPESQPDPEAFKSEEPETSERSEPDEFVGLLAHGKK